MRPVRYIAAALPLTCRVPALAAATGLALLLLLLASALQNKPPPPPLRVRDAAADALYLRATVTHVLGAPVCTSGSGGSNGCSGALEFVRYTPASLEVTWSALAPDFAGYECAQIVKEKALWQSQLEGIRAGGAGGGNSGSNAEATWSIITYRDAAAGTEVNVKLEPLAGIMRDPRPVCTELSLTPSSSDRGIDSRDFNLLDAAFYASVASKLAAPALSASPLPMRALLFDLGATRWDPELVTGFRWTVESYERLGITFDAIFAWEARPTATMAFFGPMPLRLASRTHLFNVPVARPGSGGVADALAVLRETARPQDFVVFKLDIDADALEEEIALALLQDDALAACIDDFYFEHHSDTHGAMDNLGWGSGLRRSLHESIQLFQAFRKRGIRAHSWP